nr:uncharacterized protein LOC109173125 [Ipomoea batatas]GMC63261.1 uncharacterized protein LOC109173125 [Ipomoea batatas]
MSTTSRAKKQVGGRKALGDLTNSSKPSVQQQEGYLHNHQECIKEQRRVMNMDCFHKEVGLANGKELVKFHLLRFIIAIEKLICF